MSTIATSLTEEQFNEHILPYLSTAKRGYVCKIPLYKVFNYILYRLHTGCQWDRLPIDRDPEHPEKKKSVTTRFTTTFAGGAAMAALKTCGKRAF
jgi:transposase